MSRTTEIRSWGGRSQCLVVGVSLFVTLLTAASARAQTNNAPTGEPVVLGAPQVGKTLAAGLDSIKDADGLSNPAWTYQWIRKEEFSATDIHGATDSTYTIANADQGISLRVRVTFTDDRGATETLTSDGTDTVVAAPRACTAGALWCGTLTVAHDPHSGGGAHGYCQPTTTGRCIPAHPYGALSDTDFTLDATTYLVASIRWAPGATQETGPNLHLTLDQDLPETALDDLTLRVDGHEFALSDAARGNRDNNVDHNYRWANPPQAIRSFPLGGDMTVELVGIMPPPPDEAIYLSSAEVGPATGLVAGAHVDINWEVGSAIPTGANAVIEYRTSYFWDGAEPFSAWKEVARGDNFAPCTVSSTTCVTFRLDDLLRGEPFTLEMRIVQDGSEVEVSPQLKAAAPNASANQLVPKLTVALDESTRRRVDAATGPFVMQLQFTEPYTTGYLGALLTEVVQGLAPEDFEIENGTVTAVEVWEGGTYKIKATPTMLGDPVTISLPAASVKGVGDGLTSDGANDFSRDNIASNEIVTQTVDDKRRAGNPLTATFKQMPSSHNGSKAFTFRIAFSESVQGSYNYLRDHMLTVGGGKVTAVKRVNGRNDLWAITVKPKGTASVSIVLESGGPCTQKGALCTEDGRALSNRLEATVVGPPGLSVNDVEVNEGPGATLEFTVTLDRVASDTVTVDYATSDGTATAGSDYSAATGTIAFAPGDTSATVSITVLDDTHDDDRETLTLTLTNPSKAYLADASGTGTIVNSDPLPRAWLARFGRAAALDVIDQVEQRLRSPRDPGLRGRVAGFTMRRGVEREIGNNFLARLQASAAADGAGADYASTTTVSDLLRRGFGGRDLLTGSGFAFNRETRQGGVLSLWSRSTESRFAGRESDLSLDGGIRTTMLGADYVKGQLLGGLMLAHRRGVGGYAGVSAGAMASSVTSLHPWVGYKANDRVTLWATTGYGKGGLALTPGVAATLESGLSMAMAAAGVRGALVDSGMFGFGLAFKADALWADTGIEGVYGAAGRLAATEAMVTRLRTALEASRGYLLARGLSLRPSLELGLRRDGGHAETGAGVDIAGSLAAADRSTGLSVDIRVRTLLVHQADGFQERGVSISFDYDPSPSTPLGLVARVAPSWGGQATSQAEAMWGRETMDGLAAGSPGSGRRLDAELGYALPVGTALVGTPQFAIRTSELRRDYRLGYTLSLVRHGAVNFQFGIDAQRREIVGLRAAEYNLLGRVSGSWKMAGRGR